MADTNTGTNTENTTQEQSSTYIPPHVLTFHPVGGSTDESRKITLTYPKDSTGAHDYEYSSVSLEYVSDIVTVERDINIHLERTKPGYCKVYQRTSGKKFALSSNAGTSDVIDTDIDGLVYPKDIFIVSSTYVELGILTEFND